MNVKVAKCQGGPMSRCIGAKVDEYQGGRMSRWTIGFVNVCRVDGCRSVGWTNVLEPSVSVRFLSEVRVQSRIRSSQV